MFSRHFQFAHGMIGLRGNWNGDDAVRRIRLRSCQYPAVLIIEHVKLHGPTRVAVIRIKPPTIPGADMTLTTKSVETNSMPLPVFPATLINSVVLLD